MFRSNKNEVNHTTKKKIKKNSLLLNFNLRKMYIIVNLSHGFSKRFYLLINTNAIYTIILLCIREIKLILCYRFNNLRL